MIKNNLLIFFCFWGISTSSAQVEKIKWSKANNYLLIPYLNKQVCYNSTNKFDTMKSLTVDFSNLFFLIYKKSFSDYDGDNCRFTPSCSEFFLESTKLTNLFFSSLMFFDRLTRDSNIFSKGDYEILNNKYFDPPSDYLLINTNN